VLLRVTHGGRTSTRSGTPTAPAELLKARAGAALEKKLLRTRFAACDGGYAPGRSILGRRSIPPCRAASAPSAKPSLADGALFHLWRPTPISHPVTRDFGPSDLPGSGRHNGDGAGESPGGDVSGPPVPHDTWAAPCDLVGRQPSRDRRPSPSPRPGSGNASRSAGHRPTPPCGHRRTPPAQAPGAASAGPRAGRGTAAAPASPPAPTTAQPLLQVEGVGDQPLGRRTRTCPTGRRARRDLLGAERVRIVEVGVLSRCPEDLDLAAPLLGGQRLDVVEEPALRHLIDRDCLHGTSQPGPTDTHVARKALVHKASRA